MRLHLLFAFSCAILAVTFSHAFELHHTTTSNNTTSEKAKIYIYRYKQYVGSFLQPSVYCDDVELARIGNGRYLVASVEPGQHTFRSNDKQSGVRISVKPGEQYYLRVEIAQGFLKGHGRVLLIQPEQGSFEVGKLTLMDSGK
jgi:hypothetical protein